MSVEEVISTLSHSQHSADKFGNLLAAVPLTSEEITVGYACSFRTSKEETSQAIEEAEGYIYLARATREFISPCQFCGSD